MSRRGGGWGRRMKIYAFYIVDLYQSCHLYYVPLTVIMSYPPPPHQNFLESPLLLVINLAGQKLDYFQCKNLKDFV